MIQSIIYILSTSVCFYF